jgi:glucose uptake protein
MMLPTTYATALLLTILTMICWGSWANTMKWSKWRYELFYFDYSIGVMLAAVIAAFTFGSIEGNTADLPNPAFSFMDNISIAPKRQMAYAFVGGVVFNLANLLLVAAISVAGMAVAFPIGIGLALIIGVILNYIIKPAGNVSLLASGSLLILLAIIVCAMAYAALNKYKASLPKAAPADPAPAPIPAAGAAARMPQAPRAVRRPVEPRGPSTMLGVSLALGGGLLMGTFYPLVELSKKGDLGLGPYAAAFFFAVGVLLSTPVFDLFFMNLPVQGEPVGFGDYFRGTPRMHLLGLIGGLIWGIGAISNFVASSAPPKVNVGPAISYAIGQGATLVSILWGLLYWKEFEGAPSGVRVRVAVMLALFVIGLVCLSIAPLY